MDSRLRGNDGGTFLGHVLTSPQPNAHAIFGNSPRARCNSVAASYAAAEFTADAELCDSAGAMDSDVCRTRTDPSSSVDIRLGLTELSRLRVSYDAGFPFVFQLLRRRVGRQ
ncbi:MAG: hypothetical protein JWP89_5810 [Schlesneria sp.]|nr:hypothetical protein [Schlesneria sp.]